MNFGRIAPRFHLNDKVMACSDQAIGVWTRANAWCRDERTVGRISWEQAATYNDDAVRELVLNRLWDEIDTGYIFHDFLDHNTDLASATVAARIVRDVLGGTYPETVEKNIIARIDTLLTEGQTPAVMREVLKAWVGTPGASVGLIPYLVADILRAQKNNDIVHVLRECYRTNDVTPLRKFGYWFTAPPSTAEVQTPDEMRAYMKTAQREWLKKLHREISGE